MARGRGRKTYVLAPIYDTVASRQQYLSAMREMIRAMGKEARQVIVPSVQPEMQATRRRFKDAPQDFDALREILRQMMQVIERHLRRVLDVAARRHTSAFVASAKAAMGIDISAIIRAEDLSGVLETAVQRNVALIRSLGNDVIGRIETAVYNAISNGNSVQSLREALTAQLGIADKRAQLIARDQMAKANADFNRFRHEQAGITKYRWSTAADERVRPLHARLNGTEYKYGEPTGAEGGQSPGKPIRCRCTARAVVET